MIKAKDIRVGNIFLYDYEERRDIFLIQGIREYYDNGYATCHGREVNIEKLIPIDLTKDVLESCNFKLCERSTLEMLNARNLKAATEKYVLFGDDHMDIFTVTITTNSRNDSAAINCSARAGISYLHQLQNIFYWTNGIGLELEFDPVNLITHGF